MRFFVQATAAPAPKTSNVRFISIMLAGVFVLLATAQLFSYEDFPAVITNFMLPGGQTLAYLLAAMLVVGEVLAVPFLLSMQLSPAMRFVSMVMGWLVIGSWIFLSLWINVSTVSIDNAGLLGDTVTLIPGWWMVAIFSALGVLAGWASWGMWPITSKKTPLVD